LNRVSWDDLRIFVVAARHESFRRAAVVCHSSAATVSRRIDTLEQQFGFRLFDRLPDGIRLTREGRWVLSTAERMEQASIGLRRYLDQDLTARGVIRCAVTEGLGTFWIMPKLAEFNRSNPYTVVDMSCAMTYSDVMRLEADVAVQLTPPVNPDLKVVKLGRLHVCLFAAQRYLETYGVPQSRADLAKHKIIDQVSPQIPDGALAEALGLEDLEGVVAVRTNASSAHFHAVELGIGIGALPTYAIPLGAHVVPLDIEAHRPVDIWLTYHPDVRDVPRVALFIDWLRDIFDPVRYPWFRDEFIHPRDLLDWKPRRAQPGIERATGIMAHPRTADEVG
jgi:DNA-binding transcriptional LysR family regulator